MMHVRSGTCEERAARGAEGRIVYFESIRRLPAVHNVNMTTATLSLLSNLRKYKLNVNIEKMTFDIFMLRHHGRFIAPTKYIFGWFEMESPIKILRPCLMTHSNKLCIIFNQQKSKTNSSDSSSQ